MRILFIGEIVAKPGRRAVLEVLPGLKSSDSIDLVIANAENLAHGRGVSRETISDMISAGVDYFTGGDHIYWQKEFEEDAMSFPIVCPANYPEPFFGRSYAVIEKAGYKVVLLNLMGRTFINENFDSPFQKIDYLLDSVLPESFISFPKDKIIVDFHAEASSEKHAFARYVDGRVTAVIGTHTHIPTADACKLPKGTMFVTDAGMTGAVNSVLGVESDIIIRQYLTARNQRFEWVQSGPSYFRSVLIDTDNDTITRLDRLV